MRYIEDTLKNKTILITGGAGFIGSNLAFYFQNNHPKAKVVVLDSFRSTEVLSNGNLKSFGHFKNLIGFEGEVISGDINDEKLLKNLEKNYKFDYIFHQAAISDTTALEQDLMIKTNVNAFSSLLELAKKHDSAMIYASSAATYGDAPSPQKIGCEQPQNVYGFSKLCMDNIAKEFMHKNDNTIVGLRYFNVYGPREYFKNKTASMVLQFGLQMLSGKAPKLFEQSDEILRDFIYIEDIIQANIKAMKPKKSGIYNVGTGKARSFESIVDILQKELKTSYTYEYIKNPYIGSYQFFTEADVSLSEEFLGYKARFELEDGIKDYIDEIKRVYEKEVKK